MCQVGLHTIAVALPTAAHLRTRRRRHGPCPVCRSLRHWHVGVYDIRPTPVGSRPRRSGSGSHAIACHRLLATDGGNGGRVGRVARKRQLLMLVAGTNHV